MPKTTFVLIELDVSNLMGQNHNFNTTLVFIYPTFSQFFPNRHKFFSYLFQNSFPPLFYAAFRHSSAFRGWEKSSSLRGLPTLCTKCDFPTCLEIFPFHSKFLSDNKKGAMQNSAQLQSLSMTSARYSRWHRSASEGPLSETPLHFPPSARPAGRSV